MKKVIERIMTLVIVYGAGSLIFTFFLALKCAGKVKITDPKRIPQLKPRMIIVSNHPDAFDCMYEIILIPAIFVCQGFLHPLKLAPWFTPDKRNFTDKWYWSWLRFMATPIVRENRTEHDGIHEAIEVRGVMQRQHRVMMYFIEPGRTCTGKKFLLSKRRGKRIRKPANFIGALVSKIPDISVVTAWVETGKTLLQPGKRLFSWPNLRDAITIRFGEPIKFSDKTGNDAAARLTKKIVENLLDLADQE